MKIVTKDELQLNFDEFAGKISKGEVFIHPTDTIYGIGCNALDSKAILKIRKIKNRLDMPFSVIAPSVDWIYQNCIVPMEAEKWLEKLPGPYTLILKLRNKDAVSKEVNNDAETIGVRIPNHWISYVVGELKIPVVTTSANIAGKDFMTNLENMESEIKKGVDFIVYEGEKDGKPSTIIKLHEGKEEVLER